MTSRLAPILALCLLVLGACSSTPQVQRYQVTVAPQIEESKREVNNLVLAVEPFTADVAYDQDRIVYRSSPYRLDYYHYHRWAAAPGLMLTDAMRAAYSKSGYFSLVTVGGGARADVVLSGRVTAIEEVDVSDKEWVGRVFVELQLRDARTGALVWSQNYREEEPVEELDPEGVTRAISKAVTRIVRDSTPKIAEVARSVASGEQRASGN
jgi:ABC-type uncharacterized transport system auxiliary subunit